MTTYEAQLTANVELFPPDTDSVAINEILADAVVTLVRTAMFAADATGNVEGTLHVYVERGPAHERTRVTIMPWAEYNPNVDINVCKVQYKVDNLHYMYRRSNG